MIVQYVISVEGATSLFAMMQSIMLINCSWGIKDALKAMRKLIRSQSNKTNHIGLYNVERRIELLYGREYGMTIDSASGSGTTVHISLPVIRSKL